MGKAGRKLHSLVETVAALALAAKQFVNRLPSRKFSSATNRRE